jgi:PilZ domain
MSSEREQDESAFAERRQYDRSRLIVDVYFDGADATGVASTQDISPGGLYMNTQTELPEGGLLTVRLPFAEGDVVVNAEVVYSNPGRGVGVRFHGLTEKDRALMERALARSDE